MKKKILSIFLAMLSIVSVGLYGCTEDNHEAAVIPPPPDYSSSNLQFDFYGYSALIDGWNIDGVAYDSEEDYLSVKRIKEYKDAGMTIYFPQSAAAVTDATAADWENSAAKKALDYSMEAGINKVILMDPRIQKLSKPAKENAVGLIGEGKQFATEEELDATIAGYMATYKDHPAFYGVMLGDEPFYYHAENYGQVYRSIRRVCPEAFIQYNLNPITAGTNAINRAARFPELTDEEKERVKGDEEAEIILAYQKYLRLFMDETGADYVQYDQYPFRHSEKLDEYFVLGLQVVADIAKEYNAKFYFVTQTYGQTDGVANPRMLSAEDLYWTNNMLVGFGIKQISYFTYFTKADNNSEHFIDGNSFLTWMGKKTPIYDWMQQIMAEEQKFAPTVLNFEYVTSKVLAVTPVVYPSKLELHNAYKTPEFTALKSAEINKEVGLVTELYDKAKGNYMYMVQNIVDPDFAGSKAYQTTVLTFDSKYNYAAIYVKGERTCVRLEEGSKLTLKHKPGEATYVMPY